MILRQKLADLFDIYPGEGKSVILLFLPYFLLGVAIALFETAAFSLFLVTFSAETLPIIYIANSVAVSLVAFGYLRLSQRLSFNTRLSEPFVFLIIIVGGFRLGLLVNNPTVIIQARDNLLYDAAEKRAYALEVLDLLLPNALTPRLLPVLASITSRSNPVHLCDHFGIHPQSREQCIQEIIARPDAEIDEWTKAVALFTVCCIDAGITSTWVEMAGVTNAPLVQEAIYGLIGAGRDKSALSTFDKVLILKQVTIFSQIPDDLLPEIAMALEEAAFESGVITFEKGAAGDSLYAVVSGEVRVHDAEKSLAYLGKNEVFGEMSLLDQELRMASITTTEATRSLCLSQERFYQLMDQHIDIARGIIHVLNRRIRERAQDIQTLHSQLAQLESTRIHLPAEEINPT